MIALIKLNQKPSDKLRYPFSFQHQLGFVLMSVLLLLGLLSLSAFVAVEQAQLSYKINHARLAQIKARQISEDARLVGLQSLVSLLESGKQNIHQKYADPVSDRINVNSLKHLLSLKEARTQADVYLQTLPTNILKNGTALSQNMSYSGLGSGLGSHGSFATHYELRAKGTASDRDRHVDVWTASDYRFIPK